MTAPAKPRPRIDGPEAPYWAGLKCREIRVQQCGDCGTCRFPASRFCPSCHGQVFAWVPVEPVGEVETFCVFHKCYFPGFVSDMPYAVVQVRLACGLRFFSNLVGVANEDIAIGMPVRAVFEDVDGDLTLLKFEPAGGGA